MSRHSPGRMKPMSVPARAWRKYKPGSGTSLMKKNIYVGPVQNSVLFCTVKTFENVVTTETDLKIQF